MPKTAYERVKLYRERQRAMRDAIEHAIQQMNISVKVEGSRLTIDYRMSAESRKVLEAYALASNKTLEQLLDQTLRAVADEHGIKIQEGNDGD